MKKSRFLLFLLPLFLYSVELIPTQTGYELIVLKSDIVVERNSAEGDRVTIEGFGTLNSSNAPLLPQKQTTLAGKYELSVEVTGSDTINDIHLDSVPFATMITPTYEDVPEESIIPAHQFYPRTQFIQKSSMVMRGTEITTVQLTPVQYRKSTSQLILPQKISYRFNEITTPPSGHPVSPIVTNLVTTPKLPGVFRSAIDSENALGKVLIITADSLKEPAETLAQWQRLKGYDVIVATQEGKWAKNDVIAKISEIFGAGESGQNYLFLLGNSRIIEEYHVDFQDASNGKYQGLSDLGYGCLSGNDFAPEIARGRIPVNNLLQAERAISKCITYETNPPLDEEFYNTVIGGAQYQFSFVETTDRLMNFMEDQGKSTSRYFESKATDEVSQTLVAEINEGVFLACQYDHGQPWGWSTPQFELEDVETLTNGNRLPVIYSINCLTGHYDLAYTRPWWPETPKYDYEMTCFAESLLYVPEGGAAAVLAATNVTWTNFNDSLFESLLEATWGDKGEPIYRIGDILDQGLMDMTLKMGTNQSKSRLHAEIYHCFSDPTLQIRTTAPTVVSAAYTPTIVSSENSFKLTNLTLNKGTAVLWNLSTGELLGRKSYTGNDVSIPIEECSAGDSVILAVNGQDCKPLIDTMVVDDAVPLMQMQKNVESSAITYSGKGITIQNRSSSTGVFTLYDVRGRVILQKDISAGSTSSVKLDHLSLGTGIIFGKLLTNSGEFIQKIGL